MKLEALATGVFAVALVLFSSSAADDLANRPHPLFGNSLIGNSAEVLAYYPMSLGTGICDFESASLGTFTILNENGFRFEWVGYGDLQEVAMGCDNACHILKDSNIANVSGAGVMITREDGRSFRLQSLVAADLANDPSDPDNFRIDVIGYLDGAQVGLAELTPSSSTFQTFAPAAVAGITIDRLYLGIVSYLHSDYAIKEISFASHLGMAICDFDSAGDVLIDMPENSMRLGMADPAKQQLDVSCGDFDGDGREDVVQALCSDTADPYVHAVSLVVTAIDSLSLTWAPSSVTPAGSLCVSPWVDHDSSGAGYDGYGAQPSLRLVSGHFSPPESTQVGEETRQLLLGTRSLNGSGDPVIRVQLIQLNNGLPQFLATVDVEVSDDYLGNSARFDISAGDFDGDGIDELVVAGNRWTTPGDENTTSEIEPYVKVYSYSAGAFHAEAVYAMTPQSPEVEDKGTSGYTWGCWGANVCLGSGRFLDRIAVTTGTFEESDVRDQIVLARSVRSAFWWRWLYWGTWRHRLRRSLTTDIQILSVDTSTQGAWAITAHSAVTYDGGYIEYPFGGSRPQNRFWTYWTSPALGLDAADVDSDGIDEITLASYFGGHGNDNQGLVPPCSLGVYEVQPDLSLSLRAKHPIVGQWNDSSRRTVQIADLDVDINSSTWTPELLVQDFPGDEHRITTLRPTSDGAGLVTGVEHVSEITHPQINSGGESSDLGDVTLLCGDFDGDAVRFGFPTYRRITEAVQPLVILNPPPVHYDVLGIASSDTFDLSSCYGSGYVCEDDFNSSYSVATGTVSTFESEFHSDWGVGAGLKTNHNIFGVKLETSMQVDYGQNFSRMNAETHSFSVTEEVTANASTKVYATATSYDLWEYPVVAGNGILGYVSVVRPYTAPTKQWFTLESWPGNKYPFTREPGNIFSYGSHLPDEEDVGELWRSSVWSITQKPSFESTLAASYTLDIDWATVVDSVDTKSWDLSVEAGASVEAAGFQVDVRGHYGRGELNTHSTSVSDGISIHTTADRVAYDAPYTIIPYAYRSMDGCLIVDYAVDPVFGTGTPTFWDAHYTAAPDPAFNLPRRYHLAKGYQLTDPTTIRWSPDIWVQPLDPAPGDTLTITATVHNHSLTALNDPIAVRFYVGSDSTFLAPLQRFDVLEGQWNDVAHDGAGEVLTIGGLPPRGSQRLQIRWVYECYVGHNPRVFAVIDPDGDLASEIHQNNNVGYAQLALSCGAVPVAVETISPPPFALHQNIPNPFNPSTTIRFSLARPTFATLRIYNVAGKLVSTLASGKWPAGPHVVEWDGRDQQGRSVSSGVYFYRLDAGEFTDTRKMILLR